MKHISKSWSEWMEHSRVITISVKRSLVGDLEVVVLDGLNAHGTSRTLRLIPGAGHTSIDCLEAAIELLATQIRQEIEGPPALF